MDTVRRLLELLGNFRESPDVWTSHHFSLSLSDFISLNTQVLTHTHTFAHPHTYMRTQKITIHIMLGTFVARLLLQVSKENYY